ncbi:MAG: hypothetical protein PHW04_05745 [Candidatus Wallbacteria bacterium]|nr:hypothetical protein [Candidatus Wallbacteria bacterium]
MVDIFKPFNYLLNFLISMIVFIVSYYLAISISGLYSINPYFFIIPFMALLAFLSEKLLLVQAAIEILGIFVCTLVHHFYTADKFIDLKVLFMGAFQAEMDAFHKFRLAFQGSLTPELLITGIKFTLFFYALHIAVLLLLPGLKKRK